MNLGKLIRLNRLFAHPSNRLCSVAVDHFIGYGRACPLVCGKFNPRSRRSSPQVRMP